LKKIGLLRPRGSTVYEIGPSPTLYASAGATDNQPFTIDTTTGVPALLGTTGIPRGTSDLAFSATGQLLGSSAASREASLPT